MNINRAIVECTLYSNLDGTVSPSGKARGKPSRLTHSYMTMLSLELDGFAKKCEVDHPDYALVSNGAYVLTDGDRIQLYVRMVEKSGRRD